MSWKRKEDIFYASLCFDEQFYILSNNDEISVVDIESLHPKVMVMSDPHFNDLHSKTNLQNEVLCREMMVMLGFHFVYTQSKQDDIPLRNSFSMKHNSRFSIHDHDEVCSHSMIYLKVLNLFQSIFHDQIEAWLEKSFMNRFPLYCKHYILLFVNINSSVLIISFFIMRYSKLFILMFGVHFLVGLELLW